MIFFLYFILRDQRYNMDLNDARPITQEVMKIITDDIPDYLLRTIKELTELEATDENIEDEERQGLDLEKSSSFWVEASVGIIRKIFGKLKLKLLPLQNPSETFKSNKIKVCYC